MGQREVPKTKRRDRPIVERREGVDGLARRRPSPSSGEAVRFGRRAAHLHRGLGEQHGTAARIVADEHQRDQRHGEDPDQRLGTDGGWKTDAEEFGKSHDGITDGDEEGDGLDGSFHKRFEVALPFAPAVPTFRQVHNLLIRND